MLSSSNFAAFLTLYSLFYPLLYFFTKISPLILSESGVFGQTVMNAKAFIINNFKALADTQIADLLPAIGQLYHNASLL